MRAILTICMLLGATLAGAGEWQLEKVWETEPVLITAESVNWDGKRGVLYVSCINGRPTDKDGNGFIAKLKADGTILEKEWVTGLDAPKGAAIVGATLYVANIDELVAIDIPTAAIKARYPVADATFLNDVAAGPDGAVYVSDSGASSKVYRFDGKQIQAWFQDDRVPRPNGIVAVADGLIVGSGATGNIVKIRYASRTVVELARSPHGVDGLVPVDGGFVTSDWSGHVMVVSKDGSKMLMDTTADKVNAADLGFVPSAKLILVPTFFHDTVAAYRLSKD